MNLELITLDETTVCEELTNPIALIPLNIQLVYNHNCVLLQEDCDLKLQDFSVLGMFNHSSIAGKFLFANADDLLEIIFCGQTLHSCQGFPPIPLLNSNVDQSVL